MGVNELVQTAFSGLSPLVIEDVADGDERIVVRARTSQDIAVCPVCGASRGYANSFQELLTKGITRRAASGTRGRGLAETPS